MSSKTVPVIVAVVALLAVLGGGWALVVGPKRAKAVELADEITAAEQQLAQKRAALAQPRADVTIRAGDLYRMAKALPDAPHMPGILVDVSRLAGKNGLEVRSVTPATPTAGVGYLAHPVTVVLQGRFGAVSDFVRDVQGLVRIHEKTLDARGRLYSIGSVQLGQPDGDEVTFPMVRAELRIDAFSFVETTPEITPTPQPATASSSGAVAAAGATP